MYFPIARSWFAPSPSRGKPPLGVQFPGGSRVFVVRGRAGWDDRLGSEAGQTTG
jgi:hypothetical protein